MASRSDARRDAAGPIFVSVGPSGLALAVIAVVARLAGSGAAQHTSVTVVHVAKVWGTSLGLQHPSLKPSAAEIGTAQEIAARAARELLTHGVEAQPLVISGRDVGKALAAAAERAGASTIVVGRGRAGRLGRLLRGPDPARVLLARTAATLVLVPLDLPRGR